MVDGPPISAGFDGVKGVGTNVLAKLSAKRLPSLSKKQTRAKLCIHVGGLKRPLDLKMVADDPWRTV